MSRVLVTFKPAPGVRETFDEVLGGVAELISLRELDHDARLEALACADAVLAWFFGRELTGQEFEALRSVGLVQLLSAGVDHVPFDRIPQNVPVASNAGAYAQPMAEHVIALALALAKRLPENHIEMARGNFNQQTPTISVRDSVVGILGFGGIGQASARLFKAFGARVHAIARSANASPLADWIGTLDDLDAALQAADILVVSLPLTRATRGLIAERELSLMKPEAILVNVARAAILDEAALYRHLRATPSFSAALDAWWQEPLTGGSFSTRHAFFELPNLLGSPHNSAITRGSHASAARYAAQNVLRFLQGERPQHLVDRSEYVDRR